jgi:quinol monooxygenase YgiN
MIIQAIRFVFAPEDVDRVEAIFRELREASRAEAGVVNFEVARSQDSPNVFALWEVYRDRAALDFHKATPHYDRLVVNGIRPLIKERTVDLVVPL